MAVGPNFEPFYQIGQSVAALAIASLGALLFRSFGGRKAPTDDAKGPRP